MAQVKGDLCELSSPSEPSEPYTVNVIVVPELGSSSAAEAWSDGSSCWLSTVLPEVLGRPYILEFRHIFPDNDAFEWQQVLRAGDVLLDRLVDRARSPLFTSHPILFLCHGFGGVIVKRAIGIIYEQYYNRQFAEISAAIAGIVFFGSPHPTFDASKDWPKLVLLLKANIKISRKTTERLSRGISAIADISQKFDESGSQFQILSTFENRPTRINFNVWALKHESHILVDQSLAGTGAKLEIMVQADSDHEDICKISALPALVTAVRNFLYTVRDFRPHVPLPGASQIAHSLAGWTIASAEKGASVHPQTVPLETNVATQGSSQMSGYDIIPLSRGISQEIQAVNLPCYMLEPHMPNPDFYGREGVLDIVENYLKPRLMASQGTTSPGLRSFALCGVGGVGKTQTAVEYAYAHRTEYDAIFFLNASDHGKLAQGFTDISIQLGLETSTSALDQVISKDLVLGWMAAPQRYLRGPTQLKTSQETRETSWLVVFDNADDLSVLNEYWPMSSSGSIVVTSRDPLAKTRFYVPVVAGYDLDPLLTKDAGTLLRNLTGFNTPEDLECSEQIANKTSGLPLAITSVARTVSRRRISFQELLELYNDQSIQLDIHQAQVGSNTKSLFTVWAFEDLSKEAIYLINQIAFMDPDRISENIFTDLFKQDTKDARPEGFFHSKMSFFEARTELLKSSLISRNVDLKEMSTHRIIQDAARLRMGMHVTTTVFSGVARMIYSSWPFSAFEHSTERWCLCEPIVPHISNLHEIYQNTPALKDDVQARPELSRLFMDFGWYHFERGNLKDARPVLETSHEICEKDPIGCIITLGNLCSCHVNIYFVTNEGHLALPYAKRGIEIFETHDKSSYRLPQAYNDMAKVCMMAADWEGAIVQCDLAIAGYSALEVPTYADWAQMNKGLSLCNLRRFEEASQVLENYLKYREDTFGPMDGESVKTGQGLQFQGNVKRCQGSYTESLNLFSGSLAQYQLTVGPRHFRVAAVYGELGTTYVLLGLYSEARVMYNQALEVFANRSDHFASIADVHFRLADVYTALDLKDREVAEIRNGNRLLSVLSRSLGRSISRSTLVELIPLWCQPTKRLSA